MSDNVDMYERFRVEVMTNLADKVDSEYLQYMLEVLDNVASNYTVSPKETGLIVCDGELPEICKMYLVTRGIEGLSKNSLKLYHLVLKAFFGDMRKFIGDITANDIRVWMYAYQKRSGITNRTLELYREVIRGFFRWCLNEDYIQKDPCVQLKPIRFEKTHKKAMEQMELEYIRGACKTLRETAIVETLYSTGARVSELTNIKRGDIDWKNGEVVLFGKGNKHRISYLNAKAQIALRNYLESRTDNKDELFVGDRSPHDPLTSSGVQRIIRNLSERASKMLEGRKITPHIFRHTTATVAMQNGMPVQDVQAMLGHSNINTTMIYAETNQNEVKSMHQKCVI